MSDLPDADEVLAALLEAGETMSFTVATSLTLQLIDLAEQDEWDLRPCLYTIERQMMPPEMNGEGWELTMTPVPFPEDLDVDGPKMAYIMKTLAKALTDEPLVASAAVGDRDMLGWALVNEGWMLKVETKADEDAHDLAHHPRRVEVRMVTAVDQAGVRYQATHVRGGEQGLIVDGGRGETRLLSGIVIEALGELVEATP